MRNLATFIARGIIKLIDFSKPVPVAQAEIMADELQDEIEFIQAFGFASKPPQNSEAIIVSLNGSTSKRVIINTINRDYHFALDEDGSAVFHDANGQYILMKSDGIHVFTNKKLFVNAPETDWTGDINLTGKLTASDDVLAAGISLKNHKHSGVSAGAAQTGKPV